MITPEHLHLALNHIPFLGAGFALIPLAFGLVTKSRLTVLAGLLIAVVSGWMTPFVMATGEAAYERYEGAIAEFLDPQVEKFLELHEERAHTWSKVMYANAIISTLCLGLLLWKPGWIAGACLPSALLCLASLLLGIWIAESGGLIRRPDFRAGQVSSLGAPAQNGQESYGQRNKKKGHKHEAD